MKIRPVEYMPEPAYPDKYGKAMQVLLSAKPRRWWGTPLAAGVLSATIALSVSGCDYVTMGDVRQMPAASASPSPGTVPNTTPLASPGIEDYVTMGEPAVFPCMVPLFEFGEGTGAMGCVMVAGPVFMSEEEAFVILSAAFEEAGLTLEHTSAVIENARLPVTNLFDGFGEEGEEPFDPSTTKQGELHSDWGLSVPGGLPVEFVSTQDVREWHEDVGYWVSVEGYNMRDAARTLAANNPDLAVFYDPMAQVDHDAIVTFERVDDESEEEYWERYSVFADELAQKARVQSELLLREQAFAMVEWLRGEGII